MSTSACEPDTAGELRALICWSAHTVGSATLAEASRTWITRTPRTSHETWPDPAARTGDDL